MFPPKMTQSQMEEASRKATADGMREVAEALNKKQNKHIDNSNSSDSSDTDDSYSDHKIKIPRVSKPYIIHKTGVINKNESIDKLESQIHYLRLDLANSKVETDDAKAELTKQKSINDIYMKINNEFGFIRSAIERSKKNVDDLTIKQFKRKVELFIEESTEHVVLCEKSIDKIELHEIKFALERILNAEKKKIVKYTKDLDYQVWWLELSSMCFKFGIVIFLIGIMIGISILIN
jgi:hypothetical protein